MGKIKSKKQNSFSFTLPIGVWWFYVLFCLYLFSSLYILPTSGWGVLLVGAYALETAVIAFIATTILCIFSSLRGIKQFGINIPLLCGLILSQIVLYIFMYGDCGDVLCNSGHTAIERATGSTMFSNEFAWGVFSLMFFVYIFVLILFLLSLFMTPKRIKLLRNVSLKVRYKKA